MKKQLLKIFVLLFFTGLLSGCGQTGPLYEPGQNTPYGPETYSPINPPASDERSEKQQDQQQDQQKKQAQNKQQAHDAQ